MVTGVKSAQAIFGTRCRLDLGRLGSGIARPCVTIVISLDQLCIDVGGRQCCDRDIRSILQSHYLHSGQALENYRISDGGTKGRTCIDLALPRDACTD